MDEMQEMDDRYWNEEILSRFYFQRYVLGRCPARACRGVQEEDPPIILAPMMARAATVGDIPGIEVDGEFLYRAEMKLVGLHDNLVRGICLGTNQQGIEVATCLVAKFRWHNRYNHIDEFVYGGEGGHLALANRFHMRVLMHQVWSRRNLALDQMAMLDTPVRLVVRLLRENGTVQYVYDGLYSVMDRDIVYTNEGYQVYEFRLDRLEE